MTACPSHLPAVAPFHVAFLQTNHVAIHLHHLRYQNKKLYAFNRMRNGLNVAAGVGAASHLAARVLGGVGEGGLVARVEHLVNEELLHGLAILEAHKLLVGLEAVVDVGSAAVLAGLDLNNLRGGTSSW